MNSDVGNYSSNQINFDYSSVENAMRCLKNMCYFEEFPNYGKIGEFVQSNRYNVENYVDVIDSKKCTDIAVGTLILTMHMLGGDYENFTTFVDFEGITDDIMFGVEFLKNLRDRDISLYNQNDYDDPIFDRWRDDGSTLSSSGCSFMAKCSVLSALIGEKISPEVFLPYLSNDGKANVDRSLEVYDLFGINYKRYGFGTSNGDLTKNLAIDALKEGKVVEIMVRQQDGQSANHVILLTGISADGKYVYVNDSWGPMYERKNHEEWLMYGYPIEKLYSSSEQNSGLGFSNGYGIIIDPNDNIEQVDMLRRFINSKVVSL